MKRSDMITKLSRVLPNLGDTCKDSSLGYALKVLRFVELMGMLPPEAPLTQKIIDDGLSANYWESEDE